MKKLMIIALILLCVLITPVIAETVSVKEDDLPFEQEFSGQSVIIFSGNANSMTTAQAGTNYILSLMLYAVESYPQIQYFYTDYYRGSIIPDGAYITTYNRPSDNTYQPLHVYVTNKYDGLGNYYRTQILAFPQNWEVGSATGNWKSRIMLNCTGYESGTSSVYRQTSGFTPDYGGIFFLSTIYDTITLPTNSANAPKPNFGVVGYNEIWTKTTIEETSVGLLKISAFRVKDNKNYYTEYTLYNALQGVVTTDSGNMDKTLGYFIHADISKIRITNPTIDSYNHTILYGSSESIPDDTSDNASVTVYVRNSQTGALLADAHIEIQDTTTDPWTEVVNQTLPSGYGTISLAKDPGIHLTQYRIGATVPGYQQVVPALFFRVVGPTNVIVEMEPLTGGPEDENNTFLEFYVRDINANAVANANVKVDGQLRWTNAQGYTQFEVAKNASYPYSVTKTGYLTIEGIASVENDDRYIVNVALMAGAVPTQPTVPTQTSPPIQEDNIISLSVKGLAKGFGIDYDTALLMFGLMIIFGTGGIVMSSVKGGAMEFIAGSIVGTFVAFALGLIPIWIFIIISVVFGAYVLRVFVQGGQ